VFVYVITLGFFISWRI